MSDVVDFLERLGQDSALRQASLDSVEQEEDEDDEHEPDEDKPKSVSSRPRVDRVA